jgi:hypothetical protein
LRLIIKPLKPKNTVTINFSLRHFLPFSTNSCVWL